jgi:hypothetical protein
LYKVLIRAKINATLGATKWEYVAANSKKEAAQLVRASYESPIKVCDVCRSPLGDGPPHWVIVAKPKQQSQ